MGELEPHALSDLTLENLVPMEPSRTSCESLS